jgi:hypothetical protein
MSQRTEEHAAEPCRPDYLPMVMNLREEIGILQRERAVLIHQNQMLTVALQELEKKPRTGTNAHE